MTNSGPEYSSDSIEVNKKTGEQANEALKDDEVELDTLWAEDR